MRDQRHFRRHGLRWMLPFAVALLLIGHASTAGAQSPGTGYDLPGEQGGVALINVPASARADVVADIEAEGCRLVSLAITVQGAFVLYVHGAPDFVNVDFPASFDVATPIIVRCAAPEPPEPTTQDAVATLQRYFDAIAAEEYRTAYELWGGDGAASGQTFEQFAAGYADTASSTAEIGAPGRVEGAAGSRYIAIPVEITATLDDGTAQHFAGAYTLRRSVVPGATPDQIAWSIYSADVAQQ